MVSDKTAAVVGLVPCIGIDGESVNIGDGIGKEQEILRNTCKWINQKTCGCDDQRKRSSSDGSVHDQQD